MRLNLHKAWAFGLAAVKEKNIHIRKPLQHPISVCFFTKCYRMKNVIWKANTNKKENPFSSSWWLIQNNHLIKTLYRLNLPLSSLPPLTFFAVLRISQTKLKRFILIRSNLNNSNGISPLSVPLFVHKLKFPVFVHQINT